MKETELPSLLLGLLSPVGTISQETLDNLTPRDWELFRSACETQRVGPLLRWQVKTGKPHLSFPEAIWQGLDEAFQKSTFRSLQAQGEILAAHSMLRNRSIPCVALKGAFLAFFAYPHPALRPLRDLDILVPRARALEAFQALLEQGAKQVRGYTLNPSSMMELSHQLPAVFSPTGKFIIELHTRLFHSQSLPTWDLDPSNDKDFWASLTIRRIDEQDVSFEGPEYLLLHLVVHSAYDHCFDNGPLILSDIAFLIGAMEIDWDRFWALAGRTEHAGGAALVLRLVQRYWDDRLSIQFGQSRHAPVIPEDVLHRAAEMMFSDLSRSKDARQAVGLDKRIRNRGSIGALLQTLFPSRAVLVKSRPVDPQSSGAYWYYPSYLWHDVIVRVASRWLMRRRAGKVSQPGAERANVAALYDWLEHNR